MKLVRAARGDQVEERDGIWERDAITSGMSVAEDVALLPAL
jgi:hypothetical protein